MQERQQISWTRALLVAVVAFGACGVLGGAACNKQGGQQPEPAAGNQPAAAEPKQAGQPKRAADESFKLTVEAPGGKVGEQLAATVKVVPRGVYKVNLEYPHKLQVTAPEASSPKALKLTTKDAKLSEAELSFKPAFKLSAAGDHTFEGKVRFSVCTKKQCEIKAEKVKWVFKVTAE